MVIISCETSVNPLAYSPQAMKNYLNEQRAKSDALDDFIILSPEQKRICIQIDAHTASQQRSPLETSLLLFAADFSRAYNEEYAQDDDNEYNEHKERSAYTLFQEAILEFPRGVSLRNLVPKIQYREGFNPVLYQGAFVGAVYEMALKNAFPRVVRTERIFMEHERFEDFVDQITSTVYRKKDIDLYGPAEEERTFIRTTPIIALNAHFIAEHYLRKEL